MAELGNHVTPTGAFSTAAYVWASPVITVPAGGGTVTAGYVWLQDGAGTALIRLYDATTGNTLATSGSITRSSSGGAWDSAALSHTFSGGETFRIGLCTTAGGLNVGRISGFTNELFADGAGGVNNTGPVFPADPRSWGYTENDRLAAYIEYTPAGGSTPTVTDVNTTELVYAGQTSVVITGTNFGSSQGAGNVKISPSNSVGDGGAVTQTVTSWSDTSIQITVVRGGLSLDTNAYLFVTNNSGNSNASGMVVQIQARPYVREDLINLGGAAVASETGITMLVWRTAAGPSTGSPNPDQALTVSTNGSGRVDQVITRGALAVGDPVWVAFFKNGTPARAGVRKITPVYE